MKEEKYYIDMLVTHELIGLLSKQGGKTAVFTDIGT